jgi:hypothetical protein
VVRDVMCQPAASSTLGDESAVGSSDNSPEEPDINTSSSRMLVIIQRYLDICFVAGIVCFSQRR